MLLPPALAVETELIKTLILPAVKTSSLKAAKPNTMSLILRWKTIGSSSTLKSLRGTTSYYTVACTCNGVLSFAYYEDVKFVANYKIQGTSANYEAKITKEPNAGGNGSIVLPYDYVPENITPSFNGSNLYGYERSLVIESVSGKVLFSA